MASRCGMMPVMRYFVIFAFCLAAVAVPAYANVVVEKKPIEMRKREMRGARMLENAALTRWFFHCAPDIQHQSNGSNCIKVTGVNMRIGLTIEQMIPPNARRDLISHEDGHVDICKKVYSTAEKHARAASTSMIGKTFSGKSTEDAKIKAAREICAQYTSRTATACDTASALYDKLTQDAKHPMKREPALKRALEAAAKLSH
jgi:hypothetical protein